MYFSKSKYTDFCNCEKLCWLKKYKPELQRIDDSRSERFAVGNAVGELAKGLFGEYEDTTTLKPDGSQDRSAMLEKTKDMLARGVANICEAAFSFDGLYCAVDILHKTSDGYVIYEIKSSVAVKDYHIRDIAYQKYVIENCGVNVVGAHVVVINNKYVRQGALDITQLFSIDGGKDISGLIAAAQAEVPINLARAEKVITSDEEPNISIGKHCSDSCEFWEYCSRDLPKPSVLDLYDFRKKWKCFDGGIVSFADVLASGVRLTDVQARQIDHALNDRGIYANKTGIAEFLKELKFPLYFLDFESVQYAVPPFDNVSPYIQIPFQYSLHYTERDGGEIIHKEFLGEPGVDPRRALAESLCENIPQNGCVVVYNKTFECTRLGELAELFPDLAEHLSSIRSNIVDMLVPFRKGYYYKREIGGGFTIKNVLPAVCPELDYANLDGVHNGDDAKNVYAALESMPQAEREAAVHNLLKYCERDTLALVKLWQELKRVSGN